MVAGCDGFHGVSRAAIPEGVLQVYELEYPFGWLGILASVPPSTEGDSSTRSTGEGFAMHSLPVACHQPACTCRLDPGRRHCQLGPTSASGAGTAGPAGLNRLVPPRKGSILEKAITPMRSFVAEPMSWGRLYLAPGDAAHIVPPTGAKGLQLGRRRCEWCWPTPLRALVLATATSTRSAPLQRSVPAAGVAEFQDFSTMT